MNACSIRATLMDMRPEMHDDDGDDVQWANYDFLAFLAVIQDFLTTTICDFQPARMNLISNHRDGCDDDACLPFSVP